MAHTVDVYYRYVSIHEAEIIRRTGEIPNINPRGEPKDIYITDRKYETAGRAKTHLQLPYKPAYRIEIQPDNVKDPTPMRKIEPADNPQWGNGGGTESITKAVIRVNPSQLVQLKGG
jgi:hypothetical protein